MNDVTNLVVSSDSVFFDGAYISVMAVNVHDLIVASCTEMVLIENWQAKPSLHASGPFNTREFVPGSWERLDPSTRMRERAAQKSSFVRGGGIV